MSMPKSRSKGWLARWNAIPLYVRIVIAMVLGLVTGLLFGERALIFEIPSQVILQLLGALAPPLILIAVTHVLMTTQIAGRTAGRLAVLLLLNTTVAILIGLTVANLVRPGTWSELKKPKSAAAKESEAMSPAQLLVQNVPKSILGPLGDKQNIIGVIIIAVAFGVALRGVKTKPINNVQDFVEIAYEVLLTVLHWIIQLVPIGVFAIVAKVVGTEGFAPFKAMGAFILAVLLALLLQAAWYLLRIRFFSWVKPLDVLRGDARCARDGVLDRQLDRHDAGDLCLPHRKGWSAAGVGQHGRAGRIELQQRRHRAVRGDGGAVCRSTDRPASVVHSAADHRRDVDHRIGGRGRDTGSWAGDDDAGLLRGGSAD